MAQEANSEKLIFPARETGKVGPGSLRTWQKPHRWEEPEKRISNYVFEPTQVMSSPLELCMHRKCQRSTTKALRTGLQYKHHPSTRASPEWYTCSSRPKKHCKGFENWTDLDTTTTKEKDKSCRWTACLHNKSIFSREVSQCAKSNDVIFKMSRLEFKITWYTNYHENLTKSQRNEQSADDNPKMV